MTATIDDVRRLQATGHPIQVSYGMGVDSTAMLIGLHRERIRPDAIVFADVGAEKDATYAYLPIMNAWLRSVGFPEITVVKYYPSRQRQTDPRTGGAYWDLAGECLAGAKLPSLAFQGHSCSLKWKIQAQERWALGWAGVDENDHDVTSDGWLEAQDAWAAGRVVLKMIGYDCGDADQKRGTFQAPKEADRYTNVYPLRWWGWVREDCQRVIREEGLPVPPKSSCWMCPAMKAAEVVDLAHTEPHNLLAAIALEDRAAEAGWAAYELAKVEGFERHPRTGELNPEKPFDPIKTERVRRGGLWTFCRPSKDCPTSWRAFCEREGLLVLAETSTAHTEV